jgi:methyl-accepting chemotaxis protein
MKIRTKLAAAFVATSLLSATIVGVVTLRSTGHMDRQADEGLRTVAANTMETIDRNVFERYGDVQAFGLNTAVLDRQSWYKRDGSNAVAAVMNKYAACYGLYSMMVLVDLQGRVAAVNTLDPSGKPIDSAFMYDRNFADAAWFKDAMDGKFLKSESVTGTVVEDQYFDKDVAKACKGQGRVLGFSAPVKDDQGRVIGVWKNYATWSLVESIITGTYEELARQQMGQVSLTLIDHAGKVLAECDPTLTGKTITDDPAVNGAMNLAELGEPIATKAVAGGTDVVRGLDSRRRQISSGGYAHSDGAMGYPGVGWSMIARGPDSLVHAQSATVKTYVLLAILVAAGVMFLPALWFARGLVQPIRIVIDSIKDIAEGEGDLTRRVDQSRPDEMGELGHWFNAFVAKIQGIMLDISASTREVASAATQIAASAEEMATGLTRQEEQTAQVASAVEEMSASVQEVARKAKSASGAADASKADSNSGTRVVEETVAEMKAIAAEVNGSAKTVSTLGRKSEEIGRIIGVINDIADQTNLLALNAAIESARAGEHGRGFAVVADEVRKLAERTTGATKEVTSSIKSIQAETERAVVQIEAGAGRVGKGVELAGSAGQALGRIAGSSSGLSDMVQAIAAAADQQAAASTEISRHVEGINCVTRESSQGAHQAARGATLLSQQAERLQSIVQRFKV